MLLWDVDTQVDFLSPDGHLYVPGSETIIPNLARLMAVARERPWPIISSTDAHLPGDPELEIYGPHCIVGTPGQQKVPETLLPDRCVIPNRQSKVPSVSAFQQFIIEKQEFDVFSNSNTDTLLQQFGPGLQILLYGVVTEICVASAALGLLSRGHRVALVTDATRAIDHAKAAEFVQKFLRAGGQTITVEDITDPNFTLPA